MTGSDMMVFDCAADELERNELTLRAADAAIAETQARYEKDLRTLNARTGKVSEDVREYQRRITAAFTAMDRIMSIAPSELRPEGSKVHELMEISFARIRAALNGDTLPPSPNPPGRYPNVAAYPPGDLRGVEDATVDSCDPAGEGGAKP
jgi:hypothetical protein